MAPAEWQCALAFADIGLPGSAVSGSHWSNKHRPALLRQFTRLLQTERRPAGLLLCEVGNLTELLKTEDRQEFDTLFKDAFAAAGATEHGQPQIFWSGGETVAAFRSDVNVERLEPLTFNAASRVDTWRVCERFEVIGATEHGPCSLLVYNQHQPCSSVRRFEPTQRANFCKAVLADALRFRSSSARCIGFGCGGDANCSIPVWSAAFQETPHHRLSMPQLYMITGVNRNHGDVMPCAGVGGLRFYENQCTVENRDWQRDCMIMAWCYKAHPCVVGPPPCMSPAQPDARATIKVTDFCVDDA